MWSINHDIWDEEFNRPPVLKRQYNPNDPGYMYTVFCSNLQSYTECTLLKPKTKWWMY